MTPAQQAQLRQAAHDRSDCAAALAAKDCEALAALLSNGRTCSNEREVGYGTIIETIGLEAGNQLIDFLKASEAMRHVMPLLDQGRLRIGAPLVQSTLQSLAGGPIDQADADALCALGLQPDPLTARQVAEALFHEDGSEK